MTNALWSKDCNREKAIKKCETLEGDFSANFHLTHALGVVHYTMMTVDTVSIVSDGFSKKLIFFETTSFTCFKHLSCCIWKIVGSKKMFWVIASDSDLPFRF